MIPLDELTNRELIHCFIELTKWFHYDPMVTEPPFHYSLADLEYEILKRMDKKHQYE